MDSFPETYDDPYFPMELKCNVLSHNTLRNEQRVACFDLHHSNRSYCVCLLMWPVKRK